MGSCPTSQPTPMEASAGSLTLWLLMGRKRGGGEGYTPAPSCRVPKVWPPSWNQGSLPPGLVPPPSHAGQARVMAQRQSPGMTPSAPRSLYLP